MPINPLLPTQHRPNLLQRHIAPNHPKPARLALYHRHNQCQLNQILPLAPRNVLAPHFAHTAGRRHAACSRLDARLRGKRYIFIVCHVEVARVAVVDDVKAGGGDEQGECEGGEVGEEEKLGIRGHESVGGCECGFC